MRAAVPTGKNLGEGTFGKVKLATHILSGEKVAIKVLEKDRIIDVSDVERVSREIHILKLLRHNNIVQLYEVLRCETSPFPLSTRQSSLLSLHLRRLTQPRGVMANSFFSLF